jgi:hypothetical protein
MVNASLLANRKVDPCKGLSLQQMGRLDAEYGSLCNGL